MSGNFIRYGGEPTEPPNRIYARIDRIELEFRIQASRSPPRLMVSTPVSQFTPKPMDDQARLSVLEVDFFDPSLRHIPVGQEDGKPRDWYEIKITSSRTPIRARQYTNLFGAPLLRFIEDKITIINDENLQNDLDSAVRLERLETPVSIILDVKRGSAHFSTFPRHPHKRQLLPIRTEDPK